jgi:nitrogen fixation NifU-like protein
MDSSKPLVRRMLACLSRFGQEQMLLRNLPVILKIMDIKHLYSPLLLDHYHNPRNYGQLPGYTVASGQVNPSCGDKVSLQGLVHDGVLEKLMFEGAGCMISQAAASILTEKVTGMPVDVILNISNKEVVAWLGIKVGPTRELCVILALDALRVALGGAGHAGPCESSH